MVNKPQNKIELYPLGKIKDIFIKTLYQDKIIQELMLGENNEETDTYDVEDILLGSKSLNLEGQIRNSLFIDTTQEETKAFILMDSYIARVENDKLKLIGVAINIFCNNSMLKMSNVEEEKFYNLGLYGNRIDCLIDQVARLLNGRGDIGIGKVQLSQNSQAKIIQPTKNYYGKGLAFEVLDF